MSEPGIPDEIEPQMLDRDARGRLRTLSKNNADQVARHLVMAGRLIDEDPAAAYEHAQAAMRRAGRVDVVREALAVTAYATGNYAEALRELRTVRRLSGVDAHRPMEADCERGLGRPERALTIVSESDPKKLSEHDRVELAIVASGARADLGENEAGLLVLESSLVGRVTQPELQRRLDLVRADRLEELGRTDEAAALREAAGPEPELEEEIVVLDLEDGAAEAAEDAEVAEHVEPVEPESSAGSDTAEPTDTEPTAAQLADAVSSDAADSLSDVEETESEAADAASDVDRVDDEVDEQPDEVDEQPDEVDEQPDEVDEQPDEAVEQPDVADQELDAASDKADAEPDQADEPDDTFEQAELDLESGEERP